jgi:hypothetical protein
MHVRCAMRRSATAFSRPAHKTMPVLKFRTARNIRAGTGPSSGLEQRLQTPHLVALPRSRFLNVQASTPPDRSVTKATICGIWQPFVTNPPRTREVGGFPANAPRCCFGNNNLHSSLNSPPPSNRTRSGCCHAWDSESGGGYVESGCPKVAQGRKFINWRGITERSWPNDMAGAFQTMSVPEFRPPSNRTAGISSPSGARRRDWTCSRRGARKPRGRN